MKLASLTTDRLGRQARRGFTLIEMIGVLAVIAILASLLVPKVFEAINNAKINNTALSINTVKTACVDHYAKYGTIPVDGTATPPAALGLPIAQFDLQLLKETFLDKPFAVKIGDGTLDATHTRIQVIAAGAANTAVDGANSSYDLDGSGAAANDTTGTYVVEAVITGVSVEDARALNKTLDGTTAAMGEGATGADLGGRVHYAAPASAGAPVDVHVYLTHR